MKRLGGFLLPLDGMLVHRKVTPPALSSLLPIYSIYLGGKRRRESKVSCPRTQHNVHARAQSWTGHSGVDCTNWYFLLFFSFTVPYCSNCILLQPKAFPQMAASYFSESYLFIILNSFVNKTFMKRIDCHVRHFL